MSNEAYGSLAWARRTGGAMTSGERAAEVLRGIAALARDRAGRLGRLLGIRARAVTLALAEVPVPRTPLVAAAERALDGGPPWILGHSMRSYLWGALLAARDGLHPDPELLLTAALLHDLGLYRRPESGCFAHHGAELARRVVLDAGRDAGAADLVADAIVRHLNIVPGGSVEAQLLGAGAAFEVAGARLDHIGAGTRRDIITAWPRDGFVAAVTDVLRDEAARHPETRIAFLCGPMRLLALAREADGRLGG